MHRQNKFKNTPHDVANSAACRGILRRAEAIPAPTAEEEEKMHHENLQVDHITCAQNASPPIVGVPSVCACDQRERRSSGSLSWVLRVKQALACLEERAARGHVLATSMIFRKHANEPIRCTRESRCFSDAVELAVHLRVWCPRFYVSAPRRPQLVSSDCLKCVRACQQMFHFRNRPIGLPELSCALGDCLKRPESGQASPPPQHT